MPRLALQATTVTRDAFLSSTVCKRLRIDLEGFSIARHERRVPELLEILREAFDEKRNEKEKEEETEIRVEKVLRKSCRRRFVGG